MTEAQGWAAIVLGIVTLVSIILSVGYWFGIVRGILNAAVEAIDLLTLQVSNGFEGNHVEHEQLRLGQQAMQTDLAVTKANCESLEKRHRNDIGRLEGQ